MPDSQVEQTETIGHLEKKIVTIRPEIAHAIGWVLDQTLGEPIRDIGVLLENSHVSQLETNQALRDLITDMKSSHATTRKTIYGLSWAEKAQIRLSKSQPRFAFSDKISDQPLKQGVINVTGETLELIIDTLQDTIGNNLAVLSGSSETVRKLSNIKGVRVDYEVIHIRAQGLVEAFRPFANLSEIKVFGDKNGYRSYELIPNRERVVIG